MRESEMSTDVFLKSSLINWKCTYSQLWEMKAIAVISSEDWTQGRKH
jgi:hypothetical protein